MSTFDYGAKLPDGQHERHPSLPPEARKQFVRPVRESYRHVGIRPTGALRDLTPDEQRDFASEGFVKFEVYDPPRENGSTGRYWTQRKLNSGCGGVTTMGLALAETYAARPSYYGSTFCSRCGAYFKVGAEGEFVWIEQDGADGPRVGT